MASKKAKGNRVQVILECTEHKNSERMELMKYNPILKKMTLHKEIK